MVRVKVRVVVRVVVRVKVEVVSVLVLRCNVVDQIDWRVRARAVASRVWVTEVPMKCL